jgi:hypothetical protein
VGCWSGNALICRQSVGRSVCCGHCRVPGLGEWGYERRQLQRRVRLGGPTVCSASGCLFGIRHASAKAIFWQAYRLFGPVGMPQLLRHAGLSLEGRHHCGGDDAWNIAALILDVAARGGWPRRLAMTRAWGLVSPDGPPRRKGGLMPDPVDALILDLLEWLGPHPRPYAEVLEVWRTSCPRLPVWEDANDRGLIVRHHVPGRGASVSVSAAGTGYLSRYRPPAPR